MLNPIRQISITNTRIVVDCYELRASKTIEQIRNIDRKLMYGRRESKAKILQCKAGSAKLHEFAEYYLGTRQAP